ncbi:MAG: TrmB family transcriptional regulator [Candidatus Woesearchaeota archaeon]
MEIPELSSNESLVYLSLLELKKSGATKLAQKTGLFRTLVYDLLNKLSEKGLVSYINIHGKRIYHPNPPERLLEILKEKERKTCELIPQLNMLFTELSDEVIVQQYEGVNGMKAIIEDLFNSVKKNKTKEFYFFGPTGASINFIGPYIFDFINNAKELNILNKIDIKGVWSSDFVTKKIMDKLGGQHKFFNKGEKSTSPIFIYSDKVIIVGGKNKPFTIMIKNKNTADSFKTYFKIIWENSVKDFIN